jgi:hypothetical protein
LSKRARKSFIPFARTKVRADSNGWLFSFISTWVDATTFRQKMIGRMTIGQKCCKEENSQLMALHADINLVN